MDATLLSIVTCRALPEPDPDEPMLLEALAAAGIPTRLVAWDDPTIDWAETPLTVLRSTWNYYRAHDDFIDWVEDVARVSELHNPAPLVMWNAHKAYLLDLAERGLPVVPTVLLESGAPAPRLEEILELNGWSRAVVKPAISAGSYRTHVVARDEGIDEALLEGLLAERDVLVQPYVASVEDFGERSLIFVDGALTHSVRKSPRFVGQSEAVSGPLPIEAPELELAHAVLAGVGEPLLYARVDVARDATGEPMIMELELIEPSLFFRQHRPALERFVAAIARRLRERAQ